jgi:hypothetical protein
MRRTKVSRATVVASSGALTRILRLSAVAVGIGLLAASGTARAQDDDEDDKSFEEKIIEHIMHGLGGINMDNSGIDYRERSPLVVPPKLDLPPPVSSKSEPKAANWPKDPDEARRKAAIAANKKPKPTPWEAARPLTQSELNQGKTAPTKRADTDIMQPGVTNNPMLSPSQLGFEGRFTDLFGGKKTETAQFKGEPPREALTQPPAGYQTPSPNFAYGTGKQLEPLNNTHYDIMTGKERTN